MKIPHFHAMLDGTEPVSGEVRQNLDALVIGDEGSIGVLTLTLGHYSLTPAERVDFFRKLSEAADNLADEINLRDLEASA